MQAREANEGNDNDNSLITFGSLFRINFPTPNIICNFAIAGQALARHFEKKKRYA